MTMTRDARISLFSIRILSVSVTNYPYPYSHDRRKRITGAMAEAQASIPIEHLDELTECPICNEVITSSRVLPCGHTYCLKCIQKWAEDKKACESVGCPLCKKAFVIPDGGLCELPKNILIDKIVDMMESSQTTTRWEPCDVCCSSAKSETVAVAYCMECKQDYCKICCQFHKKFRATSTHTLIHFVSSEYGQLKKEAPKRQPMACSKHGEEVRLYCSECEVAICVSCFTESHISHNCADVKVATEDLRQHISTNLDEVAWRLVQTNKILASIEKQKKDFDSNFEEVKQKISTTADELIANIEHNKTQQINELSAVKNKHNKQLQKVKQEVLAHAKSLKTFQQQSSKVRFMGSDFDVLERAKAISEKAREFVVYDIGGHVNNSLKPVAISFAPSELQKKTGKKIIGELMIREGMLTKEAPLSPDLL